MIDIIRNYIKGNKKVFKPVFVISFLFCLLLFVFSTFKNVVKKDISNQYSFLGKENITIYDKKIDSFENCNIEYVYSEDVRIKYNGLYFLTTTMHAATNLSSFNKVSYSNVTSSKTAKNGIYLSYEGYEIFKEQYGKEPNDLIVELYINGNAYEVKVAGYLKDKKIATRLYKCYSNINNTNIFIPLEYYNELMINNDDTIVSSILSFNEEVSYDEYLRVQSAYPNSTIYSYINEVTFYNDLVIVFFKIISFVLYSLIIISCFIYVILNMIIFFNTKEERYNRYLLGQSKISIFAMNFISIFFVSILSIFFAYIIALIISIILLALGLNVVLIEAIRTALLITIIYFVLNLVTSLIIYAIKKPTTIKYS